MIGQIISKTEQPCPKSASCYQSATGEVTHLSYCPIGRELYRKSFNERRRRDRENHKKFMAAAKANLATIGGK